MKKNRFLIITSVFILISCLIYLFLIGLSRSENQAKIAINKSEEEIIEQSQITVIELDLTKKDLSGANLSGLDLTGKDFNKSSLPKANLEMTNLSNANLTMANLGGANLTGANLTGANLTGANLANINLEGVDLKLVDLTGLKLSNINFKNVDLSNVNLSQTDLTEAILNKKSLIMTNLSESSLMRADFSDSDLRDANLSGANLTGANFQRANLENTNLKRASLLDAQLGGSHFNPININGIDLRGLDLQNVDLSKINLTGKDLSSSDLSNKDLTGYDLSNVNLSKANLIGTNLSKANLNGANLSYIDLVQTNLSNANLNGANLTGSKLNKSNLNLINLDKAIKIDVKIKNSSKNNWPNFASLDNLHVTNFDVTGEVKYLTTKEGLLYQLKDNNSKVVLNLNQKSLFPFANETEGGLLSVASKNKLIYISYSSKSNDENYSLVVDEYTSDFKNVRNVLKIDGFEKTHFGGNLLFDNFGFLYLSVGDGEQSPTEKNPSQNLKSYRGKVLRLDVTKPNSKPEVVAYGLRNPWGVSVDSNNRMFILDCGWGSVESVYLINKIDSKNPPNLGWPIFQGTLRISNSDLNFNLTSEPIYEYKERPGCITGGFYRDDLNLYVFGDFYGTIRFLKQLDNGQWYLFHEYRQEYAESLTKLTITNNAYEPDLKENILATNIWSLGMDRKTNQIFIGPHNYDLEISIDTYR
jgi:uncharacterized protein YjbI with pentapeptide repeats